jgi:hypothetical protein
MKRTVMFLGAAMLAAIGFGCVAPSPPPPPPLARLAGPPPACNASYFVSKARFVTADFAPSRGAPLPPSGPLPTSPDYAGGLAAAFNAAAPDFQAVLCSLDAVYINAPHCTNWGECFQQSWGWRRTLPTGDIERIVALSGAFWGSGTTYSSYERSLTAALLPASGITYSSPLSCNASGACIGIDDLPMALVAALAHEVGHIRWYEWANGDPAHYCKGKFAARSWTGTVHRPPAGPNGGYWRHLVTLDRRSYLRAHHLWDDRHLKPPQIDAIDALPPGAGQNGLIYELLAPSQPWASLFGAMTPDEDFVEAYKFKVLTDPAAPHPLTSVVIGVPQAGTANIADDYAHGRKPYLKTKVSCIVSL